MSNYFEWLDRKELADAMCSLHVEMDSKHYNPASSFCDICNEYEVDMRDPDENWWLDLIDEEVLISDIQKKAEEWSLQSILFSLQDIDLDDNLWKIDWYWWPANITEWDVECLISHLLTLAKDARDDLWLDDDLVEYLDWFHFVNKGEIVWAIEQYMWEEIYEDEWFSPSLWELSEYLELAEEYIEWNDITVNDDEEETLTYNDKVEWKS